MDYRRHFDARRTPQNQAIPGEKMVRNNAGGFAFEVDKWTRLERFCILGSEGGTYYVNEQPLTVENCQNVLACIEEDGLRTLATLVSISAAGRAPKNDPALFALAMASGRGDEATRREAFAVLPQVARIGTHIEHFANFMEAFRGWGRMPRRGIGNWFLEMPLDRLALQFLKYAQRDGWALRDLLRLAHPKTADPQRNALFNLMVNGEVTDAIRELLPAQVLAARELRPEMALNAKGRSEAIALITEHRLPREAIPTQLLNCPEIWEALLPHMPPMATMRSLAKMTAVGLIKPMSDSTRLVVERMTDDEQLHRARIHPINVLAALMTYQQGRGMKGQLSWDPNRQVVDALDEAFYKSFKHTEPSGKRMLLGLDVSGSMGGSRVNGMPFMSARVASAAMAMATARVEREHHTMGFSHEFVPLDISPRQRLDDVVRTISGLRFGATDVSLPMVWALQNRVPVDCFCIYTDNETWWGKIHPTQALREYREKMGIPAKMVTLAFSATKFTVGKPERYGRLHGEPTAVADPNDMGTLDVAGLDSAAPQVIADFVRD